MSRVRLHSLLPLPLLLLPLLADAQTGRLVITLTDMKSDAGQARLSMWAAAEDWLTDDNKILDAAGPITDGQSTFFFEDVAHGEYAISAYHDRNDNAHLDTGFFRLPKEPLGFSNNAPPRMGPPSYEASAFRLDSDELTLTITMKKLF